MHTIVLGAGVVGLTTAWYLQADGHQVTVIERNDHVASETSFANGGQLSYSYVAPLAGPGVLSKLPNWLLRGDSPVQYRPRADFQQWNWLLQFVRACTHRQSEESTRRLLSLSFFSRDLMNELLARESDLHFDHANAGKLVVFRTRTAFDLARSLLDYQRSLGCEQEALNIDACVAKEPALAHQANQLCGGIFTSSEDSGDCYQFCVGMQRLLRRRGVAFRFGTNVTRLHRTFRRRITASTDEENIDADHIVIATGASTVPLLGTLGIRVPLYPLKGYSLTSSLDAGAIAPRVSVTDYDRKIVYARLGDRLRIAGMADIDGRRPDLNPGRVATLRAAAKAMFPAAADFDRAVAWCGLRSATPKGVPIIDRTTFDNLWLNIGHGALGFTLALASGRLIGDLVSRRKTAISIEAFGLTDA
ncbi:D-amino acid dehydrogenase [Bradyrhizobium sp. RT11b]|uniref:D-amino acid dehydrogenase n=1 Tax=Bradyrhizobium sp. RT11b TaxID=3156332 RepID=UPI003393F684